MSFRIVSSYLHLDSPIHHGDARVKVVAVVLFILFVGLLPFGEFGAYIAFYALIMGGIIAAGLDPWMVARRSLIVLPFAGAAITLLFTVPGQTLAVIPGLGWTISLEGVVRFASIMFKSIIAVHGAALLILTTSFADLLWAFSALKVPAVLVAIIGFAFRYLFVLADEAARLTRARDARSAALANTPSRGRSVIFQARTTGRLIASLLIRGFARSERVYQAMVSRGYAGELRILEPPALSRRDVIAGALFTLAGLAILAAALAL